MTSWSPRPPAGRRRARLSVTLAALALTTLTLTASGALVVTAPPAGAAVPVRFPGLYPVLAQARANRLANDWTPDRAVIGPTGACGTNQAWEAGTVTVWFVEQQGCAETVLVPALLAGDRAGVDAGLKALQWAFSHQAADGSFPGQQDTFHSTCWFVAVAARTVILLRDSPLGPAYAAQVASLSASLARAAHWLADPVVWADGWASDAPYGHRRFLLAAALGLSGQLAGDRALKDRSFAAVRDGLSRQTSDGVMPEKGGWDSGYQTFSVLYALDWLEYFQGSAYDTQVRSMLERAMAWERTRILPDGSVDITGNTRTAGQEHNRDGSVKGVDYGGVLKAFAYWSVAAQDADAAAKAQAIRRYLQARAGQHWSAPLTGGLVEAVPPATGGTGSTAVRPYGCPRWFAARRSDVTRAA